MNLIIFMAILSEFKGLDYDKAQPICDKVYDFIQVEKSAGRKFSWSICNKDIQCSELSDIADSYLDDCEDKED